MTDKPAVPILPAATILMLRDDPSFEVLMVKRHHQIDFAAGALVFPGGKTHAGDEDPAWEARSLGWNGFYHLRAGSACREPSAIERQRRRTRAAAHQVGLVHLRR